jgi:hypothetical protein
MFLREDTNTTLADVAEEWNSLTGAYWGGGLHNIEPHLTDAEPFIRLGEHEVKSTPQGIAALASFADIPAGFIGRVPADEQQYLLDAHLNRFAERNASITYTTDGGITEVLKSGQERAQPAQFVDVAMAVMPEESKVTDHWSTLEDLRLDVIVPEDFDHGWGGDRAVGDITGGGIRLFQNRKQNLAPGTQTFFYRLACTNGYETVDAGLKVDARGLSVDEVMMNLEMQARRAFAKVEADIAAFYDLRTQPVGEDRTGVLRRIALDAGLPNRTVHALEDLLPSTIEDLDGEPTMFDLVNLVTNYANAGSSRSTVARNLQQVGGALISDHAARCNACHHRLGH